MFDLSQNPRSGFHHYRGGTEFGPETDDSGESTPPLWRTSPNRPLLRPNQYRNLSPEAKTQAILRGQMELMEMVGRMPESNYELSLKDLVEQPSRQGEEQRGSVENQIGWRRREQEAAWRKKSNERKSMSRNSSIIENRGFLLKMGFPVSNWGSGKKKKKKEDDPNSADSRVSPKPPPPPDAAAAGEVDGEKEWWRKRYVGGSAGESESVGLSSNSGSSKSSGSSSRSNSSGRHKNGGGGGGCWALIYSGKGKRPENE